jgi:hypothetical protein
MYFSKFPVFLARLGDKQKKVTDFTRRIVVGETYAKYHALLMPYTVKDGERIEHVAYNFYGNPNYHWVIILINGFTNPLEDWPMVENDLYAQAVEKYGQANLTAAHHYELKNGVVISYDFIQSYDNVVAVSNWDYETRQNDYKRNIKLLEPKYLNDFEMNFIREMQ